MQFWLNGQLETYEGDPDLPLMTYLREMKGIISPKDGFAPQAVEGVILVPNGGGFGCRWTCRSVSGG